MEIAPAMFAGWRSGIGRSSDRSCYLALQPVPRRLHRVALGIEALPAAIRHRTEAGIGGLHSDLPAIGGFTVNLADVFADDHAAFLTRKTIRLVSAINSGVTF